MYVYVYILHVFSSSFRTNVDNKEAMQKYRIYENERKKKSQAKFVISLLLLFFVRYMCQLKNGICMY